MNAPLILNQNMDIAALRRQFAAQRCIQISEFLSTASAELIASNLRERGDWTLVINGGNKIFEIPAKDFAAMDERERTLINSVVEKEAAYSFQFRFETIRVPDDSVERASGGNLDHFAMLMSDSDTLKFIMAITGMKDISFADAQATRYVPGHFLTRHDDNVAAKHRRLAYVYSLSSEWRVEWGGLLSFLGKDDTISFVVPPLFNALTLFEVPQRHFVSCVSPYAPIPRYSITGWIRAV